MYDCSLEGIFNRWNAAEVFWWTLTIRGNSSSVLEGHRSIADFFLVQLAIGKSSTGLGKSLDHSFPLSVLVAQPCAISTRCVFFQTKERINNTHPITSSWCHDDVQKNGSKTPKCQGAIKTSVLLFSWLKTVPSFSFKAESTAFCEGNGCAKTKCSLAVGDNLGVAFCHILCREILGK